MSKDKKREENLLFNQQYEMPEDKDGFIDESTGEIIEKKDLKPIDVIKAVAKQMGQTINDPNPKCSKCFGRGFTARDSKTKVPIPCTCIYPPKTMEEKQNDKNIGNKFASMLRKQKRRMMRAISNEVKLQKKVTSVKIKREHNLSAIDENIFVPYKPAKEFKKEAKLKRKKEREQIKKDNALSATNKNVDIEKLETKET